ncbi:hypothetical protein PISMIDRAFT_466641 [Pisolithus microcarpus 441]|uniref:Zn(2)-C6 fungal-type domain-containing protein n=1 Tax=Pisolithus microcarpus 441 TaxID=765257 RepID=A0A0C9ZLM5_9AGAM|nr:hypothetical protein BKA83DRAFT_466641 [Pisolithus microcarpus]KIK23282.1 hypothetical protein PISMIDRAFT_466641 [Pisolithus microcarpus 441]
MKHKTSHGDLGELAYDGSRARETEQKRIRGQMSCAECSRLKIKCDKRIPCQSCQRRGCETLCPNRSLSTGERTRSIVAATEHLHRRLTYMTERIRQLEDALSELQARNSTEPHPLLQLDLFGAPQHDNHVGPSTGALAAAETIRGGSKSSNHIVGSHVDVVVG